MRCPICRGEVEEIQRRPFCSERCQRIDLARWLGEGYRIEGPALDADQPPVAEAGGQQEPPWN